ncbi:MAG TPA: glycoside hydrolase family 28 protein [Chitinophagaceae bacterium]|nr:glycoside hydrolase family 28 protein [Chitinophagaceae bacterium]
MKKHYFTWMMVIVCLVIASGNCIAVPKRAPSVSFAPIILPQSPAIWFNVKDYGAHADGKTNDAGAINRAIDAAAVAGGGTVFFPAGTYLSGSIHLKSNITLYLSTGTILEAISDSSAYDAPEANPHDQYQDFGHSHWHNGFIWGVNLENIAIIGSGLIYGKGLTRNLRRDHLPKGLGDKSIALKNCHNVLLRDFKILHGGHFGILATGVDNLTIDNLIIDTNRDGMDIDCCHNVRITNCTVNSPWDDGICLKSSYALGYNRATEDVTISNCMVSGDFQEGTVIDGTFKLYDPSFHVSHTGRIKLGTESNGGFKNITITNCVFDHCQGLALETVDGGDLEDVTISNITMRHIYNMPIFLRLGSRLRGPAGTKAGHLRRVNISNIVVYNSASRAASTISGIPGHDIQDVNISHVQFFVQGGGTPEQAGITPPENEKGYPEPTMFGTLPSYGFYIRHAKGITLSDIKIRTEKPDGRPAVFLDDVGQATLRFMNLIKRHDTPLYHLKNTENFTLFQSPPLPDKKITHADNQTF